MKRFFNYALGITHYALRFALYALLLTGCGGEKNLEQDISSIGYKKVYVIGIDDEYAPMGFRDESGEIVGFDVDLAKEAARRLDITFEFRPIEWSKKVDELNARRIDLIWNGLDITPERQEHILYSKPYMNNRQLLLINADSNLNIKTVPDLAGKVVGTQAGSSSETYVDHDEELKNSLKDFRTYGTFKTAFRDLESGEVDVLLVDEIAGRYAMSKMPQKFKALELTIGSATEIGIGFRMTDVELRDEVQKVFDEMIKDGTAEKISEKWFNADLVIRK